MSVAHHRGQRDAGDNDNGFFTIELSVDGGRAFTSITSNSDTTSDTVWETVTADIPAGASVVLRNQCAGRFILLLMLVNFAQNE